LKFKIGIVGPCGSGKSTLLKSLTEQQINAELHHIAQEHSYVKDMWQKLVNPDFLIYLDVSYEIASKRRNLNWTIQEYQQQCNRLEHARDHADILINTDEISAEIVSKKVMDFLKLKDF